MKPVSRMGAAGARARAAAARRARRAPAGERRADVQLGALRISETSREVWLQGPPVPLTTQEFELLSLQARSRRRAGEPRRGVPLHARHRLRRPRPLDRRPVSKLRRKLGDDAARPTRIKTVWGKGYLLVPDAWEVGA
jgi:DNA-binding response OmpR family regulator